MEEWALYLVLYRSNLKPPKIGAAQTTDRVQTVTYQASVSFNEFNRENGKNL